MDDHTDGLISESDKDYSHVSIFKVTNPIDIHNLSSRKKIIEQDFILSSDSVNYLKLNGSSNFSLPDKLDIINKKDNKSHAINKINIINKEDNIINKEDKIDIINKEDKVDIINKEDNKSQAINKNRDISIFTKGLAHNNKGYVEEIIKDVDRDRSIPKMRSDGMVAMMVELYCMMLARDIPFNKYCINSVIIDCCRYINELREYSMNRISYNNIFRFIGYEDLYGPYLSQFLYLDIKLGISTHKQVYETYIENCDFVKDWDTALSLQNGNVKEGPPIKRSNARYLITGRDLASYVDKMDLLEPFYNACDILINMNAPRKSDKIDIYITLGLVYKEGSKICMDVKYKNKFLRPEEYSIEIERIFKDKRNRFGIRDELLSNPVMKHVRDKNGTALLTQVYPEGSPSYPSTPSLYAVIAGASATILKFYFDGQYEIEVYEPDDKGETLMLSRKRTTVEHEINKLAYNISQGRLWAGVNYKIDMIQGLKLGQKIAIDWLQQHKKNYNITFNKFSSKSITI